MKHDFSGIESLLEEEMEGKTASIRGWVYRKRNSGGMIFLIVRDATDIIQVAVKKDKVHEKDFAAADKALIESAVEVEGTVRKDARAINGFEMQATGFHVSHSAQAFPIAKDNSPEFLLDIRHLWVRSREITATMKVKATLLEGVREYFKQEGYCETTPPIIVSGAVEGGSTLFEMNYFGKKAYLSQSAQLYLEALIFSLGKVYAITPSFRAEKSRTLRHLAEYWHVEAEAAHVDLEGMLKIEEGLISHMCQKAAKERAKELKFLGRDPAEMKKIEAPFDRLRYDEAIGIIQKKNPAIKWGDDLGTEDERILTMDRKLPVFVTHYPKAIKAFYMKEDPEDPKVVMCNDCLAPEGFGEVIGGSQREDDVEKLIARLKEENADLSAYEWYLDLRRYGSVPHSGFGLGMERIVRWICKLEHIRDTIPFPRVMNRSYP
ncbi:MAG: asparagine--tRNA ligase [Candidatus Micrarchaeota archaeon]